MKFLVTGANGFVGSVLCAELLRQGHAVRAVVRAESDKLNNYDQRIITAIDGETIWGDTLCDVNVVIHLAARVHIMHDDAENPLEAFRKVNLHGTENLARAAAASGVKRLVYVSSIKVNGEVTRGDEKFTEMDAPAPQDPYGISKWEAEQALHRVAEETGLEVVIVRPPLVYGAGVKGNFAQMLKILAKGIPLPLASVKNRRSLIYVGNLVDALILCATHPDAAGQTYLVSDGEDVSTPELLCKLGEATGYSVHLFPCHPALLTLAGRVTGKLEQVARLLNSLRVDSDKIRHELGWVVPYSLAQGFRATNHGCDSLKSNHNVNDALR